jgi:Na+-driven multidrug efflux pump
MAIIYAIIRDFGSEAQAGFGVGSRVMQSIFLPAMAIAFAAPAVAGQNFGARKPERVRATFRSAILMSSVVMFTLTLLCQIRPELLVGAFSDDAAVIAVSVGFLQIISWNFVCNGVIFTCSGMFQALGNTWPALISTATRIATFAFPALWLSRQPGFTLNHVWYLSIATIAAQAVLSVALLLWQFRKRLPPIAAPTASPA